MIMTQMFEEGDAEGRINSVIEELFREDEAGVQFSGGTHASFGRRGDPKHEGSKNDSSMETSELDQQGKAIQGSDIYIYIYICEHGNIIKIENGSHFSVKPP